MNSGFMGSFITIVHVGADGEMTEIKDQKDIDKVLGRELSDEINALNKQMED